MQECMKSYYIYSALILHLAFFFTSFHIFFFTITQNFTLTYFYCYLINCLSHYISIKKKKKLRTINHHFRYTSPHYYQAVETPTDN